MGEIQPEECEGYGKASAMSTSGWRRCVNFSGVLVYERHVRFLLPACGSHVGKRASIQSDQSNPTRREEKPRGDVDGGG